MNDNQKSAFETVTVATAIVTVLLGILVWFIFLVQSGLEQTRLKHETCMVEIDYTGEPSNRVIESVTEYCGPNSKEIMK